MVAASAAASIGGSVISGAMSSGAAGDAAAAQQQASQNAINAQMSMFNTTQKNLQPYMQTGVAANTALANLMGLGPSSSGGYDQNAYQNALSTYNQNNSGGTSSNGVRDGSGNLLSGGNQPLSLAAWREQFGEGLSDRDAPGAWSKYVSKFPGFSNFINTGQPDDQSMQDNPAAFSSSATGSATNGTAPKLSDFPAMGSSGDVLNSPLLHAITMDQATLEKTPGYQFNLNQGLKSTQNAAAARGLGTSGAALKGAANFATGLADSTYQNQFNNAVTNQTNQFNRLNTVTQSGQNAAAGLGGIGQQTAANIGGNYVGAGNAAAAGINGSAASMGNAFQNAGQQLGGLYGNQNSSNAFTGSNAFTQPANYNAIGGFDPAAANNGLPWSDIRLKNSIEYLGKENGHSIYTFKYNGDDKKYVGVMAQDVLLTNPDAVHERDGFMCVDYEKLGVQFREAV